VAVAQSSECVVCGGARLLGLATDDIEEKRRSICSALNQWIASSAEIATGIGTHFASSLELTPGEVSGPQEIPPQPAAPLPLTPQLDAATKICRPPAFPSGF